MATVECKIKRKAGSSVVWDGKTYKFAPKSEGGPHVCEVSDPTLLKQLERNPSFTWAGKPEPKVDVQPAPAEAPVPPRRDEVLLGPSRAPKVIQLGAVDVPLDEIVAAAHKEFGLSVAEWNAQGDEKIEELTFAECDKRAAAADKAKAEVDAALASQGTAPAGGQTDAGAAADADKASTEPKAEPKAKAKKQR